MPHYFSYIPNVKVRISSYRRNNVEPFVVAKNIFRRIKIREDIQDDILGFSQYTISNNQRPDEVAEEQYGDPELDWVVLLCNNIINVYNDWPMAEDELFEYASSRYGNIDSVHHYETYEIKDDNGTIVMPEGKIVNSTYRYIGSNGVPVINSKKIVTNYEHERALNEEKQNIWILRDNYVNEFVSEFEELLQYAPNEELGDGEDIKLTPDAVEEIFIDKKRIYSTEYGLESSIQFAGQQELSNRQITTTTLDSGATITTSSAGTGVITSSGVVAGTQDASSTEQAPSSSSSGGSSGESSGGSSGSSGGGY